MKRLLGLIFRWLASAAIGSIFWAILFFAVRALMVSITYDDAVSNAVAIIIVVTLIILTGSWMWANDVADEKLLEIKDARKVAEDKLITVEQKESTIISKEKEIAERERCLKENKDQFGLVIKSERQNNPWLAKQISDFEYISDMEVSKKLKTKKHPAHSAAESVKILANEKRELKQKNKSYEYQLNFLENMFPWLKNYEQLPVSEAVAYAMDTDRDYDNMRRWLSPEEYSKLPDSEKGQLALDRWRKRKKSDWEAGIDYERYIGFLYEKRGFSVEYVGALRGVEDRGVDLIAKKKDLVEVVQCKRYSAVKEHWVRENTVAQIYGVTALYNMEHPNCKAKAVIYTSSDLSGEARHFAEYLGVEVNDNLQLDNQYPIIKCNIGKDGERIYHLPFDQQYDKIKIAGKKGTMYLSTPAEAEAYGFRRARKWIPES